MLKSNKVTNRKQFEKLYELLKEYPDIAEENISTGPSEGPNHPKKVRLREKWNLFAHELNKLGPPERTSQEWQRVWIHYKASLKRKFINSKRSGALEANSAEKQLSAFEQKVVKLVGFDWTENDLIGRGFSLDPELEISTSCSFLDSTTDAIEHPYPHRYPKTLITCESIGNNQLLTYHIENSVRKKQDSPVVKRKAEHYEIKENPDEPYVPTKVPKSTNNDEENKMDKLLSAQEETLQVLKDIEKTIYKNYELDKKTYELHKRSYELDEEYRRTKIELKKKKLEKLNLELELLTKK